MLAAVLWGGLLAGALDITAAFVVSAGTLALALVGRFPIAAALLVVIGFAQIVFQATCNTLLQLTTEDRFRGRIMSLYTFMFIGTAPIGALMSGGIAQRWGAPVATSVSALVLLGGAVWVFYRLRILAAREAAQAAVPAFTEKLG